MDILPGFKDIEKKKKSSMQVKVYGIKQFPRIWFDHFTSTIKKLRYSQGQMDHTIFFKNSSNGKDYGLVKQKAVCSG